MNETALILYAKWCQTIQRSNSAEDLDDMEKNLLNSLLLMVEDRKEELRGR